MTDFGSVAVLPEGQDTVTASRHSALYVPPEASQTGGYTFESDLYQVGMVLYELVNGSLLSHLQHYLPPKLLKHLERTAGLSFNLDDDCERSLAADAVIGYLAKKERLLHYGRTPQPYFSPKLRKIVSKACKPDPINRFRSAQAFCATLMQASVPNWKKFGEQVFRAPEWTRWDWEVSNGGEVEVKKSRPNRNAYRRVPNQQFACIKDAFAFVDCHLP